MNRKYFKGNIFGMNSTNISPYLVEKPWGGKFISHHLNINPSRVLGEAFLVSTLADQESEVGSQRLSTFIGTELPYLIKIIDANDNLSIQVHPNDFWAEKLENSVGKTECWLILGANENSGVYLGFKDGKSWQDLIKTIQAGENASECLNFIPVQKGDFITVPAGTIHAIGAGVQILEFQQASGITYRIWDWGREGRELHLEKASLVSDSSIKLERMTSFSTFKCQATLFEHQDFYIKKMNENVIVCGSNRVPHLVSIDLKTLNIKLS